MSEGPSVGTQARETKSAEHARSGPPLSAFGRGFDSRRLHPISGLISAAYFLLLDDCCSFCHAVATAVEEPHRVLRNARREVRVAHGHVERGVTKQLLDHLERHTPHGEV